MNTNRKITEYQVVASRDTVDFGKHVNEEIQAGWQPYGGVSAHILKEENDGVFVCAQAMVKYED